MEWTVDQGKYDYYFSGVFQMVNNGKPNQIWKYKMKIGQEISLEKAEEQEDKYS